ncbi:hypothetical protein AVEN_83953-1 [Araneus ventricosus]|uniref:Ig-like domain-containing protein n=1 Tax=Araneus ventricosus TaxID=182803 RepID=A0A4Y2BR09_ARAVE|nr:hypothetical protein AVEN_83953-1 [Araneus ventricosus]
MQMRIVSVLLKYPFLLLSLHSSELENHCPVSNFLIRVKSNPKRDQGNRLVLEIPECDVLEVKPLDVNVSPKKSSLTAGRRVEVRCYSGGSRPASRMSWFLDNEPLSNHTELLSIDGNRTTSILTFWPSRSDHKKYLRCRTENFLLSGSALEDGWHLNITYVPQVSLTVRSSTKQQHSTFLEGDDVRFSCEVKANPSAYQVGWYLDGKHLISDDPDVIVSYRSLLIRRVKRKDRGRYQCYANNAEGTGISRAINLRALYNIRENWIPRPALASEFLNESLCNSSSTEAGILIAITEIGPTPSVGGSAITGGGTQAPPLLYPLGKREPAYLSGGF